MPRRVSMKGKGADLFFSGDLNGDATVNDPLPQGSASLDDTERPIPVTDGGTEPKPITHVPADATGPTAPPHSRSRAGQRPADQNGTTPQPPMIAQADPVSRTPPDTIELIRKIVKAPGREVSFVRLTPEEKGRLVDIVYTYKRQGVKTSENEINRIAVNFMLHDYAERGEASVLARVIAALRA